MADRERIIRAVLQVALSVAVIIGAVLGSQVLLLLSVMAVVGLIVWEFDARRRPRA